MQTIIDRSLPPATREIDKIDIPQARKFTLDNGIPVYAISAGFQDLVKVEFLFPNNTFNVNRPLLNSATNKMLADAVEPWAPLPDGQPFPDDQHLLQMELLRSERLQSAVLHEDPRTINHRGAKFIRQFLRSHGSPEERLAWIEAIALTP